MIYGCTEGINTTNHKEKRSFEIKISDSIPLFNDSLVFEYFDINAQKNKILLYGKYAGVHELDLSTNKLTEVATVGRDFGQINLGLFIAKYLPGDKVIVAEIIGRGKIYLFDRFHNLVFSKHHARIFPEGTSMAPFICSNIDLLDSKKDTTVVGLGVQVLPTNALGWEKEKCYSKLIIVRDSLYFHSAHFPLEQNKFFAEAVEKNIEYSPFVVPRIDYDNNKIYLKFLSDNNIYYSDKSFKSISRTIFTPYYKTYNFFTQHGMPRERADNYKQNFSNLFIESFNVLNNKAYLIYPKPVPPERAPKTREEVREWGDRKRVLHVLDLKSHVEWITQLPPFVDGHNLIVENDSIVFLLGDKNYKEDNFIYKGILVNRQTNLFLNEKIH